MKEKKNKPGNQGGKPAAGGRELNGRTGKKRIRIPFQISLMWFLIITILIVGSIIFFPLQWMFRENIYKLVVDVNAEIMDNVNREISSIFTRAVTTQHILKETFENGVVDITNKEQRELYYFSLLKANPSYTWVSFGFPNGDFFGVQRENDKQQLNVINNYWDAKTLTGTRVKDIYVQKNDNFVYQTSTSFRKDYSSLDRPWYKSAVQEVTDIWTDVYIFDTSYKPGINTAISLSINGKMAGVISVAFELEDISLYLKSQKIGKTGSAYIINSRKELLATQNPGLLVASSEKEPLKTFDQFDDPLLEIGRNAMVRNGMAPGDVKDLTALRFTDPRTSLAYFVTLMPSSQLDWVVMTVIPASDYLAEIEQNTLYLLAVVAALFVAAAFLMIQMAKLIIVRPIHRITDQLVHIENFRLDKIVPVPSRIREIDNLSVSLGQMTKGLLSFQKYLPTELVQDMISAGIEAELGGQERELTMFFSDIVSFTNVFEKMGNKLIPLLGEYLGAMSEVILKNCGSIDKYIGDSVMAFWGAPHDNPDHALGACKAAIMSQRVLEGLQAKWNAEGNPALSARIGINTGLVVVGNVGSSYRLNYTVLGDAVNLASRLESLNKMYHTSILIGESTYKAAALHIIARNVDRVTVYGKTVPEDIYELLALRDELGVTDRLEWIKVYEEARQYYLARKWKHAVDGFKEVIRLRGKDDYPSRLFIQYCVMFSKNPPPENWQGVNDMRRK